MKTVRQRMRRGLCSAGVAAFLVMLAAYSFPGAEQVKAQQQRPRGQGAAGGSGRPTGGAAVGPGEGAQAVSADPSHGATPPQEAPRAMGGVVAYPDRPKAPKEVLDRGKATYSVNCAFCHGSDAGGGSIGPNLLRSEVVLQDKDGEMIMPIVHGARIPQGMPRIDISDAQVKDVAGWLHSLRTGGNMRSTEKINILVGDAGAGKAAFDRTCASCHSGEKLKGFVAMYTDPRAMQQAWLLPGGAGGGRPGQNTGPVLKVSPVTATVTEANGKKTEGKLDAIDDFYVAVTSADGAVHRFTRSNDMPRVDIHDPLAPHRALFRKYNDKDIHDITAYLVTLK